MSIERKTIFSADRLYRYTLWREWREFDELPMPNYSGGLVQQYPASYAMFIGLNPSTADETQDDPTIRRCIGFAKRWGFAALCMTNLFAFRATIPSVMKSQRRPVGDENDRWLMDCAREAGLVVAAWGVHGTHMSRAATVMKLLGNLHCLRRTRDGHPEHPLYLPATILPISYA